MEVAVVMSIHVSGVVTACFDTPETNWSEKDLRRIARNLLVDQLTRAGPDPFSLIDHVEVIEVRGQL